MASNSSPPPSEKLKTLSANHTFATPTSSPSVPLLGDLADTLSPDWVTAKLNHPGIRFLFLRWNELLHARTPISHQANVHGTTSLLRELRRLHELRRTTDRGAGDLAAVTQEAFGIKASGVQIVGTIVDDPIVTDIAPAILLAFKSATGATQGNATNGVTQGRLEALAQANLHRMETAYVPALCTRITTLLDESAPPAPLSTDQLAQLDHLISALATECLTRGYAESFLRLLANVLLSPHRTEMDRVARMLGRLRAPRQCVGVIIKAQASSEFWEAWPTSEVSIHGDLFDHAQVPKLALAKAFAKVATGHQTRFAFIEAEAWDHHGAGHAAFQRFQRIVDTIFTVVPDRQLTVVGGLTIRHEETKPALSRATREDLSGDGYDAVRRAATVDTRAELEFAAKLFKAGADARTVRRLAGALRFYRISLLEGQLESGFSNLWTALEVISHEGYGEGAFIVDRVVRSIAPIITAFKANDLTRDMTWYLRRGNVFEIPKFASTFPDLYQSNLDPVALLRTLSQKDCAAQLCALLTDNPLLQRRIMVYHENVQTGHALRSRVLRNLLRVEWQIRRLYSVRNALIHGADPERGSRRLLEHLRLYAATAVHTVTRLLSARSGLVTLEDALAMVDLDLQHWMAQLQNKPLCGPLMDRTDSELRFIHNLPFAQHLGE